MPFYTIGGHHTVEAHRRLVETREIVEAHKTLASTFNIILIWVHPSKFEHAIYLSKALNQNIADEQKEQCFTKQLINARVKWREMGSPQPSILGRLHSLEFLVNPLILSFCVALSSLYKLLTIR